MGFLDSFKNIFKRGGGSSVLGIDVGSSAMKIVQLKRERGRAVLETYGEIALGPYADKSVGQAVSLSPKIIATAFEDLAHEAKVTTHNCGVAIPLSSSLINLIKVPNLPEEKLGEMIPIEARKYIPVPISEVLLDWYLIPEGPGGDEKDDGKKEALIVAIHKDVISRYQSIIKNTKLNASFFEIEAFSTSRGVLDRGIEPVAVVDMGASSTKLYISQAGVVRDSHIINEGSQDITQRIATSQNISFQEAEERKRQAPKEELENLASGALNHIFSEIRRVISQYQRTNNISIVDVHLSGGGSELHGVLETADEFLDAELHMANPFSKVEAPAFLSDVLIQAGPEFSVAVGVALRKLEENS
ncbi:MAG: type IV pilus assembly protein PilM [Candidatus Paceibacterota bacterium]